MKPECRHNDTSCTSYYAGLDMITQLIVQQDHVYLIANEDSVVNEKNETVTVPARILQMDLDGNVFNEAEEFYFSADQK